MTLHSRYGVGDFEIAGVLGEYKLFFNGKEPENIHILPSHIYDYVLVSGINPNVDDLSALRKKLAEQIQTPNESIIFDFEIYGGTFSLPKVCLVVMFNHRFDKNLPLLRKIYGERFSDIKFLMPFYDGADADVIPVYESSHQFQGYFIQAYDKLKDIPCTHYLFIGDDLIIRPDLDEINFTARTNMHGKKFLDCKFTPINNPNGFRWYWAANFSKPFYDAATSWKNSLLPYDKAIAKFNEFFGTKYNEIYDEAFFGNPNEPGVTIMGQWNNPGDFINVVNKFIASNGNSLKIPYPMAGGYSDIFCVDKTSLFEFSRLCGIFSAMNLFVEAAIPTAAVLTFKRDDVAFFSRESGVILWNDDRIALEKKYDKNFSRLYREWQAQIFFIHPVKLSGWKLN